LSYDDLSREFLERVEEYRSLGVNPLTLATGCAVKIDLVSVLYPALRRIKESLEIEGLSILPRRDADIFKGSVEGLRVHREIYRSEEEVDQERLIRFSPERAVVLVQIYQRNAGDPELVSRIVGGVYEKIARSVGRIVIGKGHSIVSADPKAQFMLFDFVRVEGDRDRLVLGNNDTIQIIDPAESPGSLRQTAVALGNSLNDLYILGAWRNTTIIPVADAPSEKLKNIIEDNMRSLAESIGARILRASQPSSGALLMGATVFAETDRTPPMFYDRISPGMIILASRPFGELAPINVYLMAMYDRDIAEELRRSYGITIEKILEIKRYVIDLMSRPNIHIARIIEGKLPQIGEEFDPSRHIAATTDVTGPGVYVIKELAELSGASIRLERIPLISPELSEFATRSYIMPNATAGTNGAVIFVASERVIEEIEEELRGYGENPVRIGRIISREGPRVLAPSNLRRFIASKTYLREFEYYEVS
jgi:selenophosphate synthase